MRLLRSFRHALTANFILLACLPVLLFGVIMFYLWQEHLEGMASDTNRNIALELVSDTGFFLIEARRELEQVAEVLNQGLIEQHGSRVNDFLNTVTRNSLSFETILLLDETYHVRELGIAGREVAQYKDFIGIDMSRHELLEAGTIKQPSWSSTFLSLVSGKPTVTLAVPLKQGVLLGNVSLSNLNEQVSRLVESARLASIAIVGRDRDVIVSNQREKVFEQVNFGFHPEILRALEGTGETGTDVHWEVEYLESVARIPETGWVVWVGQEYDKILAPAIALRQTLVVFLGVTLLVAVVAAVRKSSMLMRPIQGLLQRTVQIGQGQRPDTWIQTSYNEIEALSAGLSEMFEAINLRENNLQASEERFRLVFSLSPDAGFLVSAVSGALVDVNQGLLDLCDVSRDEFLSKNVQSLRIWMDPRQWSTINDMLRMRGKFSNHEISLRTQSGKREMLASATRFDMEDDTLMLVIFRDISEIRRTESQLKSSEQRYRTVVESIEEGLMVFNESGAIVACNPSAEKVFGSRDTLLGKSYRGDWTANIVSEEGRSWAAEEHPVSRSLRHGNVVRNEIMGIQQQDGSITWLEANSSPLLTDSKEGITGAVLTFMDVTERRQRRELLDNVASGVTRGTGSAFFDSLTKGLTRALSADYVIVSELHPDKPGFFRTISVMTPQGRGENMEYAQQGTPCNVVVTDRICSYLDNVQELFPEDHILVEMGVEAYIGRVLHDEKGEALGLIAVMYRQPIEESTVAEQLLQIFAARAEAELERGKSMEALRTSEKHLRRLSQEFEALLEGIPDQILLVDRDYRLIWANHSPERGVEGYPELCHQIFHDRESPCPDCPVSRSFLSKQVEENEMSSDGRHFMMRAVPILDAAGDVEKVIQMVQETTEKVRMQQAQQHSSQLAALGELAAGVAHEINNPVNGIINYAQLIMNRFGESSELKTLCERVVNEGNRIASIVSELLFFAREGGDEVHVTSWQQIVDDSLLLVGNQMRKDNIAVDVSLPSDLPKISSVSTQLQQIVLNLLSNARHALNEKYPQAHPDKRIVVSGRSSEEGGVELLVTDYGPGIPKGMISKVLQPFYTTKPAGVGTGIGLSICHDIVSRHGGSIEIESDPDHFTQIRVVLPVAAEGEDRTPAAAHRKPGNGEGGE